MADLDTYSRKAPVIFRAQAQVLYSRAQCGPDPKGFNRRFIKRNILHTEEGVKFKRLNKYVCEKRNAIASSALLSIENC